MKRKILSIFMASVITASIMLTGCSQTEKATGGQADVQSGEQDAEQAEDVTKLVVSYRTFGTTPSEADVDRIENELNKITREKINAEVELMILSSGSYINQMNLMLSGDEPLDVMGAPRALVPSGYAGEEIIPLQELVDEYGQGIKDVLGEDLLRCGEFNAELYSIPIKCDSACGYGAFVMRKDICEKYNIDAESIDSYEKLTEAFQIVHDNEPDMIILSTGSTGTSFLQFNLLWDPLGDSYGVLDNHGETLEVVNLFETDAYREYLDVVRDWYERGFISQDVTNATEAGSALMKAGNLFAYSTAAKPGSVQQEQMGCGMELELCQVLPTFTVTGNIWQWTIPANSKTPEKAMEFINLMYTNADVINLMAFGIEGEDYVIVEDGTANYPEGVDATTCGFNMGGMLWSLGNEFIGHVWNGNDPNLWKQTEEWNKTGLFSKAYGFVFYSSTVANEETAVKNVYDQYRMSLECGVVDPESTLKKMNEELYAAGLQKIMDEKQSQLDKWAQVHGIQ